MAGPPVEVAWIHCPGGNKVGFSGADGIFPKGDEARHSASSLDRESSLESANNDVVRCRGTRQHIPLLVVQPGQAQLGLGAELLAREGKD